VVLVVQVHRHGRGEGPIVRGASSGFVLLLGGSQQGKPTRPIGCSVFTRP